MVKHLGIILCLMFLFESCDQNNSAVVDKNPDNVQKSDKPMEDKIEEGIAQSDSTFVITNAGVYSDDYQGLSISFQNDSVFLNQNNYSDHGKFVLDNNLLALNLTKAGLIEYRFKHTSNGFECSQGAQVLKFEKHH